MKAGDRGRGTGHGGNPWLACGLAGTELADNERRLLEALRPGGVVLFARNVVSREQLLAFVSELRALSWRPYVAVDLEGGRVNRLRELIGPLPAVGAAARAGGAAVAALGEALGAACAHFGIGVDFAPVLDVAHAGGWLAGEDRCLGHDADQVARAAAPILAGLERRGVAGCLKHYPGLGGGAVDSHSELPELDDGVRNDVEAFHRLAAPGRAVMVAHALAPALGDGLRPASLSPLVVGALRRRRCGPVVADDLEMGALARYGEIPERAAAALLAGCDQVLVCNALAERVAVVEHVLTWTGRDDGLARAVRESASRLAGFGTGELAAVQWPEVEAAAERARRLAGMVP